MRSLLVLLVCTAVASVVPAAAVGQPAKDAKPEKPADDRSFWRFDPPYSNGYFKKLAEGKWEEVGNDGKKMGDWEELARTPDYVELYDAQRNYKTRLGAGKAWMTSGRDSTKFGPAPAGNWEKPDAGRPVANGAGPKSKEEPKKEPRKEPGVRVGTLRADRLEVGQIGTIDREENSLEVVQVLDDKSLVVSLYLTPPVDVEVKVASTKGIADGKRFTDLSVGDWRVTGTQKVGRRTLNVLEQEK